jgi:alpha-beta hydrolase superfamily lysophospholipase
MRTPVAQPLFFGSAARPLFGWLHRVEARPRVPLGVVLCNPFGYEAISTHRTLRHFAQGFADSGIPALRFDYDGAGDSAGTDLDPDRLAAWVTSVHRAAETLRRESGCERLIFFGIRLGATLAALAASQRSDTEGLIALAPVVNAKAYMRELRALQMAGRTAEATSEPGDDVTEVTGFVITAATRTALSTVDLLKLERPPAAHVLILDRHDLPGNERWLELLQSQGADAARQALPGYPEMMLSPHSALVPEEMLSAALAWTHSVSGSAPPTRGAPAIGGTLSRLAATDASTLVFGASTELPPVEDAGAPVVERALHLEPELRVFGILTHPKATPNAPRPTGRGILLLNAGGTHHIGPNRMYVMLARRWAAKGHAVLRLDLSGIGESAPHPGEAENTIYSTSAATDIALAARYLRERVGTSKCYAIGLCSGAYHALKAAVGGVPLDSIVMINPLTFFWKEGMSLDAPLPEERVISEAQRYQKTILRREAWVKLLRGQVNVIRIGRIIGRRALAIVGRVGRDLARRMALPLRNDLGRELEAVARGHTRIHFVFAAEDPGIELLRTQAGSTVSKLSRHKRLRVEVIRGPYCDHTFTARRARAELTPVLESAINDSHE